VGSQCRVGNRTRPPLPPVELPSAEPPSDGPECTAHFGSLVAERPAGGRSHVHGGRQPLRGAVEPHVLVEAAQS
jgi:hypothetical protein